MTVLNKLVGYTKRYSRNTAGAMAMTWGVILAGMTFTIGASYDLTQVSKARAIAQVAADNMALTASIAVDFNNNERYVEGQSYSYTQLGGPKEDFTRSMHGSVVYDIVDDQDPHNAQLPASEKKRLLARATVSGTYKPAFMSVAPWIDGVAFEAVSDVAYAQRQGTPASIFFVTDNSGSMKSRDDNYVRKIDSLKVSMNDFMTVLGAINVHGERIFRTALYPYSSSLITGKIVDPDWGSLTANEVNRMYAGGGTRSTSALTRAKSNFTLEADIHDDENSEDDPLKFLIFMSDGANNGSYYQQQCVEEDVWVPATSEYWQYTHWRPSWKYGDIVTKRPKKKLWKWRHYPAQSGHWDTEEQCTSVKVSPENNSSLAQCTAMKDAGVKIYSIAYDVAQNERELAEQFMKDCSSNNDHGVYTDDGFYKYAADGTDLQAVFTAIGEAVVKEVIRVKR